MKTSPADAVREADKAVAAAGTRDLLTEVRREVGPAKATTAPPKTKTPDLAKRNAELEGRIMSLEADLNATLRDLSMAQYEAQRASRDLKAAINARRSDVYAERSRTKSAGDLAQEARNDRARAEDALAAAQAAFLRELTDARAEADRAREQVAAMSKELEDSKARQQAAERIYRRHQGEIARLANARDDRAKELAAKQMGLL